jgi:exopolysaccharide production protein ExoQ
MHLPSNVALWLTIAGIFFVYRWDNRENAKVSKAIWIPIIWLFITGSRPVSDWLNSGGGETLEDGSPVDAAVFFILMAAGCYVLRQRRVDLATFARNNRWLLVFFIYALISIVWSDFPFIAFKRWIKVLGHPIMVLIVLTEPYPIEAAKRLFKRLAFALVPLSICLIKYLPQLGRGFDQWTGEGFNGGVAVNKNELGCTCMIFGIFFFWNVLQALKIEDRKARRKEVILSGGIFALNLWLLMMASSATSLAMMILGIGVIWFVGLKFVNKRYVGAYLVTAILLFAATEPFLGIYATVVKGLGRNLTLTGRTDLWMAVLQLQKNPLLGTGFESFWLGSRLEELWKMFWWCPLQAHNGYIEIYLNLGLVGILLYLGQFLGTFRKIQRDLFQRFEFARLRLGFLLAIIIYNYTEAAFDNLSFVWTMFFLIAIDYPLRRMSPPNYLRERRYPKMAPVTIGGGL